MNNTRYVRVFSHTEEGKKSPKLFTWVLNPCKMHLQADYHTHLSASNPDLPPGYKLIETFTGLRRCTWDCSQPFMLGVEVLMHVIRSEWWS